MTAASRRSHVEADRPLARRIGASIRQARLAAGLTQAQLAGPRYTKAYVSALENGLVKPSVAALSFLSERLSLPVVGLLATDVGELRRALLARLDLEGHGAACVERCLREPCPDDHWCGACAAGGAR